MGDASVVSDGCVYKENARKIRPSSSYAAVGVYGHISKRSIISRRLRPQTAHHSSGSSEARSAQTGETGESGVLADAAISTGKDAFGSAGQDEGTLQAPVDTGEFRNDDDAMSVSELENVEGSTRRPAPGGNLSSESFQTMKAWTAEYSEQRRPSTAPVNQVHSSGSRFFTSTEAFEEFLMTRENKFRNQRLRR
jgi:hypothetical protein